MAVAAAWTKEHSDLSSLFHPPFHLSRLSSLFYIKIMAHWVARAQPSLAQPSPVLLLLLLKTRVLSVWCKYAYSTVNIDQGQCSTASNTTPTPTPVFIRYSILALLMLNYPSQRREE